MGVAAAASTSTSSTSSSSNGSWQSLNSSPPSYTGQKCSHSEVISPRISASDLHGGGGNGSVDVDGLEGDADGRVALAALGDAAREAAIDAAVDATVDSSCSVTASTTLAACTALAVDESRIVKSRLDQ
jgi:hypothetical protein